MSAKNNQNRKLQKLIDSVKISDDAVGNAQLGQHQTKTLCFMLDPDSHTVGAHVLNGLTGAAQSVPINTIVTGYHVDVSDPITSDGSATIALGFATDGAAIVKAATAFDDASYVAATQKGGVPVASKKLTAARPLLATVATAALTAGTMLIYIQYIESAV